MNVPFLSYDDIKAAAAATLSNSDYADRFPVAIEMIVERTFRMDVVPMPGLRRWFNIDAFISQDLQTLSVDESVMENCLARYRFSLAHELGHRVLHADILGAMRFSSVSEWKTRMEQFPDKDYRYLEYQANVFANCLLVPADQLDGRFEDALARIRHGGINPAEHTDICLDALCDELGPQFEVSPSVIGYRLKNKGEDFQSRLR
jgi:hypothetical protein